jgi:hypothetical protein
MSFPNYSSYLARRVGKTNCCCQTGATGPTGSQGITGPQGIQGITGPQGIQGITGPQGIQGITGPQGIQGITGPQGIQGITGPQGIQGITGPQGIQGITGPQGIQGITGPQGIQGITGPQGIQGITGPQGIQGITGPQGIQGITGPQGIQGITGPQGIQGITGPQGIQGITGPQGIQGIQGITGPQGIQGITGPELNTENFVFGLNSLASPKSGISYWLVPGMANSFNGGTGSSGLQNFIYDPAGTTIMTVPSMAICYKWPVSVKNVAVHLTSQPDNAWQLCSQSTINVYQFCHVREGFPTDNNGNMTIPSTYRPPHGVTGTALPPNCFCGAVDPVLQIGCDIDERSAFLAVGITFGVISAPSMIWNVSVTLGAKQELLMPDMA